METSSVALFAHHGRVPTGVGRGRCGRCVGRLHSRTIPARHRTPSTDHRRAEAQRLHDDLELSLVLVVQAQVKVDKRRRLETSGAHQPWPFHQSVHHRHAWRVIDAAEQSRTWEVDLRKGKEPVTLQTRLHARPLPRHDRLLQLLRALRDLRIDRWHRRVHCRDLPVQRLQVRLHLRPSPLRSNGGSLRGICWSGGWIDLVPEPLLLLLPVIRVLVSGLAVKWWHALFLFVLLLLLLLGVHTAAFGQTSRRRLIWNCQAAAPFAVYR